jgi:hypothetical protein
LYIARDQAGFDIGSLRQGDILEGVPFPQLDLQTLHLLGKIVPETNYNSQPKINAATQDLRKDPEWLYNTQPSINLITQEFRNDKEWLTAVLPVRFGLSIILSNCCDLEPRNGRISAPVLTLARLHRIPETFKKNAENYESLKANKDPRENDPGYIDYFYLEPHESLGGVDWRVHFNQVSTVPTDAVLLLRKKILQLDDRTRMKFKIKLGEAAGLENPWQEPTPAENGAAQQAEN